MYSSAGDRSRPGPVPASTSTTWVVRSGGCPRRRLRSRTAPPGSGSTSLRLLGRPGGRRRPGCLCTGSVRGHGAVRHWWGVRQLPGSGTRWTSRARPARCLRPNEIRAASRRKEALRPRQRLPHQSQHPAGLTWPGLSACEALSQASTPQLEATLFDPVPTATRHGTVQVARLTARRTSYRPTGPFGILEVRPPLSPDRRPGDSGVVREPFRPRSRCV